MEGFAAGTLVRHQTLGTGKVVAVEPQALHVFFPASETRFAAKLRWPAAGAFLSRHGLDADPWLEGLNSFSLDPESGRWALASNFIGQDEAVATFLAENPGAFSAGAPAGRGGRLADRDATWRRAIASWESLLGQGQAARLLADEEHGELARRLLRVAGSATSIPGMPGLGELEEAFAPGDESRDFFAALVGYLSVPSPARARFERLAAAVHSLGASHESAWPLVTFFPFVAVPGRQVVLIPRSACAGASRLGSEILFTPTPGWVAYGRFRDLAIRLLAVLGPSGARDLGDAECFLHLTGARRAATARDARAPRRPRQARAAARPAPTTSRRKK